MTNGIDIAALAQDLRNGNRRALARCITLVESGRADDRAQALMLLDAVGHDRQALRIGLSGSPGVGKSTFIEAFGLLLTGQGLRVAVLAVDPSSSRNGGSILGDKTRMERLARDPLAFIRPSPSRAALGGVTRRTREAVALCEAAGFDVVLIETVGVGQSETMVADLCDVFTLLLAPAGGDELQGVKRGIMEMADLILVNKADGDLAATAMQTCAEYASALQLLRRRPQDPPDFPQAACVSARSGKGLEPAWAAIRTLADFRKVKGHWLPRRAEQGRQAFLAELREGLLAVLAQAPFKSRIDAQAAAVAAGQIAPEAAAAEILAQLGHGQARLAVDAACDSP